MNAVWTASNEMALTSKILPLKFLRKQVMGWSGESEHFRISDGEGWGEFLASPSRSMNSLYWNSGLLGTCQVNFTELDPNRLEW